VLTRPRPPTAQYKLISAYVKAAIAAAYAVMVPSAAEPKAVATGRPGLCPVLLIMVQYW